MSVKIPSYSISQPLAIGTRKRVTISEIKEMKAGEIFGPKARNPEQPFYAMFAKVDGRDLRIASMPKPDQKIISPRHKLARFKEKYGAYPEKGMKVEIETNENGFWNLVL